MSFGSKIFFDPPGHPAGGRGGHFYEGHKGQFWVYFKYSIFLLFFFSLLVGNDPT